MRRGGIILVICLGLLAIASGAQAPTRTPAEKLARLIQKYDRERDFPPRGRKRTLSLITAMELPRVASFLVQALPLEKAGEIKNLLARALGSRIAKETVTLAMPGLWPDLDPAAQEALCRNLAPGLPEKLHKYFLQEFWKSGIGDQVRSPLVKVLALPPGPGTVPFLQKIIEEEKDLLVLSAATLLVDVPLGEQRNKLVVALLEHRQPAIVAAAVLALPMTVPKEFLARIKEVFDRELRIRIRPHPQVATALATRLADDGGPVALPMFIGIACSRPAGLAGRFRKLAASFNGKRCISWWIGKGLKNEEPFLRLLAVAALAAATGPRVETALQLALRDKDPTVQRAAARVVGKGGGKRALPQLERMLKKGPLENRLAALDALHRIKKDDVRWPQMLFRLFNSRQEAIRARALDHLGGLQAPKLFPKLVRAARAASWITRSAFYGYARKVRDPRAIPVLIDRLPQETGRLQDEVERALFHITGVTFGYDFRRWRSWWREVGKGYKPPPRKEKKEDPLARKYGNSYYGIPVVSKRSIFILDVSDSMQELVGTGKENRLDRAKEALKTAILRFDKDTSFNLIFFQTVLKTWERALTPATPDNLRRALKYVKAQSPLGMTNVHGALQKAFADPDIDTIYLLTDGAPTAGKITDPTDLAEEVFAWNLSRRIVINTISLGGNSPFLQMLAAGSGGQYVKR